MRIAMCGTRGSTPAPGREFLRYGGHTSCVAVTAPGAAAPGLILDAGTGIRNVTSLLAGGPFTGTIALTHLHWDHVHGLPFFRAGDRDDAAVRVLLPAPPDGSAAEAALERGMSPPHFPITPRQLRGSWEFSGIEPGLVRLGPLTLLAREIPHKGGRTFGYRVSDGSTSFAYLPDHSPTNLGPGPDGLGEYHDAAMQLADGADILMHDSFWYAEDFDPAETLGHAAAEYAIGLAVATGARQVLLVHHRPDRTDSELEKLAAGLRDSPVPVALAADGQVMCL
ncbi:MAG TPA: MBL fold metallo-hydrolase [Streptosporangiaceae bacterium]|nr:MBL fold metallo-hydrolase [Streptosporangiaceae bacterium]